MESRHRAAAARRAACVACGWLGWRRPGTLLAIVLASFAIGPQWVLAGYLPKAVLALALPAQKGLLIAALAANLQRFGVRPGLTNWPLLAVLLLALQSLLLADLGPAPGTPASWRSRRSIWRCPGVSPR